MGLKQRNPPRGVPGLEFQTNPRGVEAVRTAPDERLSVRFSRTFVRLKRLSRREHNPPPQYFRRALVRFKSPLLGVYISCWVFCPSRLSHNGLQHPKNVFQSRAGFSVRRDLSPIRRGRDARPVSIPCWVFCPSRPNQHREHSCGRNVSIPCWVFCPSRPDRQDRHGLGEPSFNPVLGFLSVATSRVRPRTSRIIRSFNPVLGFLSVATAGAVVVGLDNEVSIPCWVFCPSRLHDRSRAGLERPGFNPVLGFLSVATLE